MARRVSVLIVVVGLFVGAGLGCGPVPTEEPTGEPDPTSTPTYYPTATLDHTATSTATTTLTPKPIETPLSKTAVTPSPTPTFESTLPDLARTEPVGYVKSAVENLWLVPHVSRTWGSSNQGKIYTLTVSYDGSNLHIANAPNEEKVIISNDGSYTVKDGRATREGGPMEAKQELEEAKSDLVTRIVQDSAQCEYLTWDDLSKYAEALSPGELQSAWEIAIEGAPLSGAIILCQAERQNGSGEDKIAWMINPANSVLWGGFGGFHLGDSSPPVQWNIYKVFYENVPLIQAPTLPEPVIVLPQGAVDDPLGFIKQVEGAKWLVPWILRTNGQDWEGKPIDQTGHFDGKNLYWNYGGGTEAWVFPGEKYIVRRNGEIRFGDANFATQVLDQFRNGWLSGINNATVICVAGTWQGKPAIECSYERTSKFAEQDTLMQLTVYINPNPTLPLAVTNTFSPLANPKAQGGGTTIYTFTQPPPIVAPQ